MSTNTHIVLIFQDVHYSRAYITDTEQIQYTVYK